MSYLDPKERVIDLKLTSYGRHLIAMGKFKPTHYAFFDDDIIYDGEYASMVEDNSDIESRIQEETPRITAQPVFSARETAVFNASPNVIIDLTIGDNMENLKDVDKQALLLKTKVQEGPEQTEILQQPLGRTNSAYNTKPAWNVGFLKAPLSSSTEYLEVSGTDGVYYRNIPQLNADIQYYIVRNSPFYNSKFKGGYITDTTADYSQYTGTGNFTMIGEAIRFTNGASIAVLRGKEAILRIEETNTFFQNENFEIECFEVETVDGKENLVPLKFLNEAALNTQEDEQIAALGAVDLVSQCLDILADTEIPVSIICPILKEDKRKQFFHRKVFDCEDYLGQMPIDMYTEEDDTGDIC